MGLQKHFGGFLGVPLNSVCLSVWGVLLEVRAGFGIWEFPKLGGVPYFGVLMIRILIFGNPHLG